VTTGDFIEFLSPYTMVRYVASFFLFSKCGFYSKAYDAHLFLLDRKPFNS